MPNARVAIAPAGLKGDHPATFSRGPKLAKGNSLLVERESLAYCPLPRSMWSDDELLHRWRNGDASAGDQLLRRHYEPIRRFFDLRIPADADDLTQQAFLACCAGLQRKREGSSFRSYVFGAARNLLMRKLRDRRRFERMARFRAASGPDTALTPSGVVALRQEHKVLLRALDEIPTDAQIALQLYYWEGLNSYEIADVLGISKSGVTSRLHRAREALRKQLEQTRTKPEVRDALLADLEGWTRSLVPAARPIAED